MKVIILFFFLSIKLLVAQPSNDSLFAKLKQEVFHELADSLHNRLSFNTEIVYTALPDQHWQRVFTLTAKWGAQALSREYQDTLSSAQLRQVRRHSSPPLRGDSPQMVQKTLLPALGLLAGTAGVVLLFYLRSR